MNGVLGSVDVRAKLAVFVAVSAALSLFTHPWWNLGLLAGLVSVLLAARLPMRGLWAMVRPLLAVLALIVLFATLTGGQRQAQPDNLGVLFAWGPLMGTRGGLLAGVNLVVRILLMVVATYAFTATTPPDDVLLLLSLARAPNWLSILVPTALAFVPTLTSTKDRILEAQRARGSAATGRGLFGRPWAVVAIMVPLLTTSILTANNLAIAMTSRGYGASRSRTALRDLRLRPADVAIMAGAAAVLAGALYARLARGWGVL